MKGKIFNAQEVQAILNGSKVMFREVIKPQPKENDAFLFDDKGQIVFQKDYCPYQVGQKIFCKESFEIWDDGLVYKADNSLANTVSKWKPARYMKQEHSRLTPLIKSIGVERLGDISEEDCWKEGLEELADYQDQVKVCQMAKQLGECIEDPRPHFATYWVSIRPHFATYWNATHKKPEEKFEANPWVWCVTMEVVK